MAGLHITQTQDLTIHQNQDSPSESRWRSELDVENLGGPLLRYMCTLLSIKTFGRPEAYLRYVLGKKLDHLAADDRLIQREGITSLTPSELLEALHERGLIRHGQKHPREVGLAPFAEDEKLLQHWLNLTDHPKCPPKVYPLLDALHVWKSPAVEKQTATKGE